MNLQETIARLSSEDEGERMDAAEDVAGSPEGIAPLVERVQQEPSRAVREVIFRSLAETDDAAVISEVIKLLGSEDAQIRNEAVGLLQLRGAAVLPELRSLLTDPNRDLRKLAVDVLSRLTDPGIDDLYEIALRDQDANVVITALGNMRRCLPESRTLIVQHAVQNTNPMLALAAMDALITVGNQRCLEEVRGRFPDPLAISPLYAPAFLRLVARYGGESDVHFLLELVETGLPRVQPVALDTLRALLVRIGISEVSDDCWKVLLACLPKPKLAGERYEMLSLLGHFAGREQVFTVLVAYLQSHEKLERIAAIEALSRYRPDEARTALMACMAAERDPEVREILREAGHVGQL